jgi:hypothetical protein
MIATDNPAIGMMEKNEIAHAAFGPLLAPRHCRGGRKCPGLCRDGPGKTLEDPTYCGVLSNMSTNAVRQPTLALPDTRRAGAALKRGGSRPPQIFSRLLRLSYYGNRDTAVIGTQKLVKCLLDSPNTNYGGACERRRSGWYVRRELA